MRLSAVLAIISLNPSAPFQSLTENPTTGRPFCTPSFSRTSMPRLLPGGFKVTTGSEVMYMGGRFTPMLFKSSMDCWSLTVITFTRFSIARVRALLAFLVIGPMPWP